MAGPRTYSFAGLPGTPRRSAPVGWMKPSALVTLRWKFLLSSDMPQTISYTRLSSRMVNSSPQKVGAMVVCSSRLRARSSASFRIWSWSKASWSVSASSTSYQSALSAPAPATGTGRFGAMARKETVTTRPRGSRPGAE
ncbi:hypothetical protein GCM10029992_01780 [Glycomyces albus]